VAEAREPGWREVGVVVGAVVAAVIGLVVLTTIIPGGEAVVYRSPLAILVLIVGTALVLIRIAGRRPPDS
jgi:hypothetical protein